MTVTFKQTSFRTSQAPRSGARPQGLWCLWVPPHCLHPTSRTRTDALLAPVTPAALTLKIAADALQVLGARHRLLLSHSGAVSKSISEPSPRRFTPATACPGRDAAPCTIG